MAEGLASTTCASMTNALGPPDLGRDIKGLHKLFLASMNQSLTARRIWQLLLEGQQALVRS
jgi:hypothetical protein